MKKDKRQIEQDQALGLRLVGAREYRERILRPNKACLMCGRKLDEWPEDMEKWLRICYPKKSQREKIKCKLLLGLWYELSTGAMWLRQGGKSTEKDFVKRLRKVIARYPAVQE